MTDLEKALKRKTISELLEEFLKPKAQGGQGGAIQKINLKELAKVPRDKAKAKKNWNKLKKYKIRKQQ